MKVRFLFLGLVLALLCSVQGFAQTQCAVSLAIQLPMSLSLPDSAAEAAKVATAKNGFVAESASDGSNMHLLCLPVMPNHLWDNDIHWMEVNRGVALPSGPHVAYVQPTQSSAPLSFIQTQPALTHIRVPEALNYSAGLGVNVAVIDTYVDRSNPDLQGHLGSYWDLVASAPAGDVAVDQSSASYLDQSSASYLDQSSASYLDTSGASYLDDSSASYLDGLGPGFYHGTCVAGIVAATAPSAAILTFRAFDTNGSATTWRLGKAIRLAALAGAQVINLSDGTLVNARVLEASIAFARAHGVRVITTSAGNYNSSTPVQYPAGYSLEYPDTVITVAATKNDDEKESYSNYGSMVSVDAPGTLICPFPSNSPFPNVRWVVASGTSFSAPATAGLAADLLQQSLTGVASRIFAGATNTDSMNPGYIGQLGHGVVNFLNSVQSPH